MKNGILAILLLGMAGALLYIGLRQQRPREEVVELASPSSATTTSGVAQRANTGKVRTPAEAASTVTADGPVQPPPPGVPVSALAEPGASRTGEIQGPGSSLPAATVLENMRSVFRQYISTFGENPVGTNEEITKALQGDNPKQINFLGAGEYPVNQKQELLDPWGTPYFFHQLSAQEMEIRSAGPDKRLWTADDLIIK